MAPAPHPRHGQIGDEVGAALKPLARRAGLTGSGPLNIGSPDDYRVPDRAYLREQATTTSVPTAAIVVEIVSRGDETYEKFGFYFDRGVDEVVVVDSSPGAVEGTHEASAPSNARARAGCSA